MTEYETARIVITRTLVDDGEDIVSVSSAGEMTLVEALGLLRLAEDTVINRPEILNGEETP